MLSEREQAAFQEIQRRYVNDPDSERSLPAAIPAEQRTRLSRTLVNFEGVATLLAVTMVFMGAYGWAAVFVAAAITLGLANHAEVQSHRDTSSPTGTP